MTIPFIGRQRAAREYPFKALVDAQAILAGGSDWMISSANPIDGIHVAVNRKHYGADGTRTELQYDPRPLYPANAISLAQGLTAYTHGTAVANDRQHVTGRLAPGYAADFVILDQDPFLRSADDIGATGVVATYIAGQEVYHRH